MLMKLFDDKRTGACQSIGPDPIYDIHQAHRRSKWSCETRRLMWLLQRFAKARQPRAVVSPRFSPRTVRHRTIDEVVD